MPSQIHVPPEAIRAIAEAREKGTSSYVHASLEAMRAAEDAFDRLHGNGAAVAPAHRFDEKQRSLTMDRASLLKQLLAVIPDLDQRTQDSLTDEQITDIVKALGGGEPAAAEPAPATDDAAQFREIRRFADRSGLPAKYKTKVIRMFSERRKREPLVTARQHARECGIKV